MARRIGPLRGTALCRGRALAAENHDSRARRRNLDDHVGIAPAKPEGAPKIIFAALDAAIARELEPQFAEAGCAVVSNSSALRMQADVPLVIPEVNGDHIALIDTQPWRKKSKGFAVTNPNCSAIGLVVASPLST